MTFTQFLSVLRARWWVLLLVLGLTVATTVVVSLLLPRQFTATAGVSLLDTPLGIFLGTLVAVGTALLLELMGRRVRKADDAVDAAGRLELRVMPKPGHELRLSAPQLALPALACLRGPVYFRLVRVCYAAPARRQGEDITPSASAAELRACQPV